MTVTDAQGYFTTSRPATRPSPYGCPTGDTLLIIKAADYQERSSFISADCGTYTYAPVLTPVTP